MIGPELLAQVRRIQLRTQRTVTDLMAGGYLSAFRGSGIEFDQVRAYEDGDDPRAVDWNVTARSGELHVKQFVEERELSVLFVLDLSGSTGFGSVLQDQGKRRRVRDVAAEFCACIALAAQRNNDKAGLIAYTDRIESYVPPRKGSQHVLRLVRDVLALEPEGRGSDLGEALDHALRVRRRHAVVFVVSDFAEEASRYERALRRASRRHDVIAVRIEDPWAKDLPRLGLLRVEGLEGEAARLLDTGSKRVRRAFAERRAAHDRAFEEATRKAGVDVLELGPDRSLVDELHRFFRRRDQRRQGGRG